MSSKSEEKRDAEALAYVEKAFPCITKEFPEEKCDSWGVCDNCCEATIFWAGYNFGEKAPHSADQAKLNECAAIIERRDREISKLRQRLITSDQETMNYSARVVQLEARLAESKNKSDCFEKSYIKSERLRLLAVEAMKSVIDELDIAIFGAITCKSVSTVVTDANCILYAALAQQPEGER